MHNGPYVNPKDSVTPLIPIRDENGGISSLVPIDYTAKDTVGADALRITSIYGKTSSEAVQSWIDQGYLLYADRKNISRSFPRRLQLPGRIKTANRFLDESDFAGERLGIVADEESAVNEAEGMNAKLSTASGSLFDQPSLFDQVYQPTFDFNRQNEQPKQTELDFCPECALELDRLAKRVLLGDKGNVESVLGISARDFSDGIRHA